jgi:hypothetical protein
MPASWYALYNLPLMVFVGQQHNISDGKASFNDPKNEQQKPLASEPGFLTA